MFDRRYGFSLEEFLLFKIYWEVNGANATKCVHVQPQCRSVACSQGMPAVLYFSRHACKQERKESSKFSFDVIDYIHIHNYC